ncbi:hypothetical protein Pla22_04100 [Rubripirellula amarantea]|uniref:Uncharacterized protein n=1 Tax=Rubripirellula amarantea TaxID=2527999 RepID=A0A5C5WRT6_9BACT|nr:hypothetical protein [Rubripirellula amarantea]TWT52783.1 hypothetical protein Pla22_04100 [Rubripirellula amarantea]
MSLPITPVTAAAARMAGSAVSRVSESLGLNKTLGFDQILQGASGENSPVNLDDAKQSLVDKISETLSSLGLPVNPPPKISVQDGGRLQVENNIPQAAQIEAALNSDVGLTDQATRLIQLSGGREIQFQLPDSST